MFITSINTYDDNDGGVDRGETTINCLFVLLFLTIKIVFMCETTVSKVGSVL